MSTAVGRVDVVCKGEYKLVVGVVILHGNFCGVVVLHSGNVYDLGA